MSDHSLLILALAARKMARRPLTNPRKIASQERSRATVDALVEATARILVREGFDKASTNRIAEVAGVSVGSLYQYFPSKEALVAAVIERHNQEIMQAVRGELAEALRPADGARRCASSSPWRSRRTASIPSCIACSRSRFRAWESSRSVETFNRENYALFRDLPREPPR